MAPILQTFLQTILQTGMDEFGPSSAVALDLRLRAKLGIAWTIARFYGESFLSPDGFSAYSAFFSISLQNAKID